MSKEKFLDLVDLSNKSPSPFIGEKKYISTGDVNVDTINLNTAIEITFDNRPSRANVECKPGDVLFAKMAGTNKAILIDDVNSNYIYSTGFSCATPKSNKVTPKCLYYLVTCPQFLIQKDKHSSGSTQKAINNKGLSKLFVEVPDLSEQDSDTEILDKIVSLRQKARKCLELCDLLVKSQFIEMFGDCNLAQKNDGWSQISDVAKVISGSTPKTNHPEYWGGRNYWITPDEIGNDSFYIYETKRKITDEAVKSCSLHLLPQSTVLLTSRAPIGKVAIAGVDMYCNQGFKNIVCGCKLNPIYLFYLLKYNESFLKSLGRGATFKEISKSIVEAVFIPCPNLEKQNEFESFVGKINRLKLGLKEMLDSLDALYKSMQQKYFG